MLYPGKCHTKHNKFSIGFLAPYRGFMTLLNCDKRLYKDLTGYE